MEQPHKLRSSDIQKSHNEFIRVSSFDTVRRENLGGKIAEIERYDEVRPRENRRSEDVAIVGVGKIQTCDQRLVTRDEAISNGTVHLGPGLFIRAVHFARTRPA